MTQTYFWYINYIFLTVNNTKKLSFIETNHRLHNHGFSVPTVTFDHDQLDPLIQFKAKDHG